jgi:hypothetical protein
VEEMANKKRKRNKRISYDQKCKKEQLRRELEKALRESNRSLQKFNPNDCKACEFSVDGLPCFRYEAELEYNTELRIALSKV